jgi:hypothetical protein
VAAPPPVRALSASLSRFGGRATSIPGDRPPHTLASLLVLRSRSWWMRLIATMNLCACGVRGEKPEAEDSRRFQPPNLGEAVSDAVGEMCPNSAPAMDSWRSSSDGRDFLVLGRRSGARGRSAEHTVVVAVKRGGEAVCLRRLRGAQLGVRDSIEVDRRKQRLRVVDRADRARADERSRLDV